MLIEQEEREFTSVNAHTKKVTRRTATLWYYTCEDCDHKTGWMTEAWAKWAKNHHSDRCTAVSFDEDVALQAKAKRRGKRQKKGANGKA